MRKFIAWSLIVCVVGGFIGGLLYTVPFPESLILIGGIAAIILIGVGLGWAALEIERD